MPASSRKGMRRNECKSKEQPDPGTAQGNAPPGAGKDPPLPLFRGVQPHRGRRERGRPAVYPHPLRQRHRPDARQGPRGLCRCDADHPADRGRGHPRSLCAVAAERLQQPHHLLRQPRPAQCRPSEDPDPPPLLPRQPPLRRHRQPDDRRCGHLCRRPADGLHPAVLRPADHLRHPAVHAVGECPHHAGGRLHHPAEPGGSQLPGQAQLQVFSGAEHRAR